MSPQPRWIHRDYDFVRQRLLEREEIALLDVREEAPHAEGHPLFAANLPYSRLELNVFDKLPRFDVPIVTIDSGEGLAAKAADKLVELGYSDVAVFDGGIEAWQAAGGELFIDVNVPSKAFGEWMEASCDTPSLPAPEVKALLDSDTDMVVVDVRRFDEYRTMCIPTAINVPGAELVLRLPDIAPDPNTTIIVNCAGRTRSLVGTQSLINAGFPNPVYALRNGTIGWTLADQTLDHEQTRSYRDTTEQSRELARARARQVADQAGVGRATVDNLAEWRKQRGRTSYFFDVRGIEEYQQGHLEGFYPKPGGQLVQELEMVAPVRGARIVLVDDDGVRANMCASWLAQMAWEVFVVDGIEPKDLDRTGPWQSRLPEPPAHDEVSCAELEGWMNDGADCVILDFALHAEYTKGHIPGARFVIRSQLERIIDTLPAAACYVITCSDGELGTYIAAELELLLDAQIKVLAGGTAAWIESGRNIERGDSHLLSAPIDRYRRPYEGTQVSKEVMQAYLDWEFGLVEQLKRDGTHHFQCINAKP